MGLVPIAQALALAATAVLCLVAGRLLVMLRLAEVGDRLDDGASPADRMVT